MLQQAQLEQYCELIAALKLLTTNKQGMQQDECRMESKTCLGVQPNPFVGEVWIEVVAQRDIVVSQVHSNF